MDFRDIFDRSTNVQFSILFYLVDYKGPVEKEQLMNELDVSNFILDKSVEELSQVMTKLQLTMKINCTKQSDSLQLENYHWDQVNAIYTYFLKNSLSYNLIVYLYENRTYTIPDLVEKFAISEATVYRQIAKLNSAIAEFEVKIKNGKLIGDNLQLSHFFFQFFWNSMPIEEIEHHVTDPEILRFINLLEIKFERKFTHAARMRMALWCRILKVSSTKNVAISKTALELVDEFQDDPIYQIVRESYFLSLSYSAFFGSDYKAASIYIFLSTGFYIDTASTQALGPSGWPTYSKKVEQLNDLIYAKMCELLQVPTQEINNHPNSYWKYLLTQIHSAVVYLKGIVIEYDSRRFFNNLFPDLIQSVLNTSFLEELIAETEAFIGEDIVGISRRYISWIYSFAIDQLSKDIPKALKIGVQLVKSPLLTVVYVENLKKAYGRRPAISIEAADVGKHYDILISDSESAKPDFSFDRYYSTQEIGIDYTVPLNDYKKLD